MAKKGIIFDIQRASFHDGPGIRTTVFLKGCPLNCLWCHNPESISADSELFCNQDKCILCRACKTICPNDVHSFTHSTHEISFDKCIACGKCGEHCISDALKIVGREMTPDQVLAEIIKDKAFYDNSGGGMTLSGGEPMLQFEFSLELLKICKKNNINTCVETCGFASKAHYEQILPYVDYFLYDYKESDPQRHKQLTGVSNETILSNLDYLYSNNAAIILRCPLVASVNDSPEHLRSIAELSQKYPDIKSIEILPYHNTGRAKNLSIGKDQPLKDLETTTEDIKYKWMLDLKAMGCNNIKFA